MDHTASSGSEGGTVYHSVIDFVAQDGQQVRFQDSMGSSPPRHQIGEQVEIRYSPTNPHDARLPGVFGMWFLPGLFGLLGLVFGISGAFWLGAAPSASDDPGPAAVATFVPGIPTDLPGAVVPSVVPGAVPGSSLTVSDGGQPKVTSASCDGFRKAGKRLRELALSFEGETLVVRLKPYTGAGPYLPGQNASVKGSFFGGAGPVSGAVIVDASERAGVVNLVAGQRTVSGAWACTEK